MIAVDSSVIIAAFASWHESHEAARQALDRRPQAVGHAAAESYSVLTRLPPPHRAPATLVRDFLLDRFTRPYLVLPGERLRDLLPALADSDIIGGATYDALIGLTARECGATLLSNDRRAAATYEAVGVQTTFLDPQRGPAR